MYRFFTTAKHNEQLAITGSDAFHISNVLRLKSGDKVQLVTADAHLLLCELQKVQADTVLLQSLETIEILPQAKRLVLAQGLVKGDKMDFVIQKAVELGVTDIVPLALSRCVVELEAGKAAKRVERWQKIAHEAAKQSKHSQVPTVHAVITLKEFLQANTCTLCMLAYEEERTLGLKEFLRAQQLSQDTAILIGPEGGFDSAEVKLATASGFTSISLGKQILRTETAPLMLLSILKYEREL